MTKWCWCRRSRMSSACGAGVGGRGGVAIGHQGGELRVPRSGEVDELSVPHSAEPELAGEVELPSNIKGELCVPRSGEVDSDLDTKTTKDRDMDSDLDMDSGLDSDYQEFCSRRNAFLKSCCGQLA